MLGIRALLGTVGAFLLSFSGQTGAAQAATGHPESSPPGESAAGTLPGADNTLPSIRSTPEIPLAQGDVQRRMQRPSQGIQQSPRMTAPGAPSAAHANSGPTTHSNVPGHANFTKTLEDPTQRLNPSQVQSLQRQLGGTGASHVNSGPTTHSNVPGHANFTKNLANPAQKLNPAQIETLQQRLR